jgi:hypothetical protein
MAAVPRTSQEGWGSLHNGPIIDAHTHPMLGIDDQVGAEEHPPEAYRKLMSGSPIARAAALTIAPASDMDRTRARNDALLRLAGASGGFFFPVCSVHPADGQAALTELDRVAAAGCAWLKLHPNTQAFDVADPGRRAAWVRRAGTAGHPARQRRQPAQPPSGRMIHFRRQPSRGAR